MVVEIPKGVSTEVKQYIASLGRQALHARQLTLQHPVTGETLTWKSELPDDMQKLLDILRPAEYL